MNTMPTIFVLVALVSTSLAASIRHGSENAYINGEIIITAVIISCLLFSLYNTIQTGSWEPMVLVSSNSKVVFLD